MEKNKLTAEAVNYLNDVSTLIGANRTSSLIGKTFNILSLNISDILDEKEIAKEIEKNPNLDFLKSEKYLFRGTLSVKLLGDNRQSVVYLSNPLIASLKQAGAITFRSVGRDVIYDITPKAVKLLPDRSEVLGNNEDSHNKAVK